MGELDQLGEYFLEQGQAVAHVGSWISDGTGHVTWSREMYRVFGVEEATRVTVEDFLALVHPEDRARVSERWSHAIRTGEPYEGEYRIVRPDRELRWIRSRAVIRPAQEGGPARVVGVGQDITDWRRALEELEASDRRCRESLEKTEAMCVLAGGVAHDLNNLLSVIMNYCEFVTTRLKPGEALRSEMEEMGSAAQQAVRLTNQLVAVSRQQVLAPRVIDIGATVAAMEKTLRRLLGDGIELRLATRGTDCRVHADPGQIEQVLLNLVVNARDAMPGGGRVAIEARAVDVAASSDDAMAGPTPGRYVLVTVSDTGVGMDVATRARIFEPFFTTKPEGRGTGLGLATVSGIVSQSGGRVSVESDVGRGSTFHVYLPHADGSSRG